VRFEPRPSDTTADLLGVCVLGPDAAFAVGRGGVALRWEGTRWEREDTGTDEDLYAVCAQGNELYAVGGNLAVGGHSLIAHRAGGRWTTSRSPVQSILLAVDARDGLVRASGFNGALVEKTPEGWRELAAPTNTHLFGIHATGSGWLACGLAGTLVELPTTLTSVGAAHLTSLAACGDDEVAVGFDGTIARRSDGRWQVLAQVTREHLWSITSFDGRAIAVGAHGAMVEVVDGRTRILDSGIAADLHGVGAMEGLVIAVGRSGTIIHG